MTELHFITWYLVSRSLEKLVTESFPELKSRQAIEALKLELLHDDTLRQQIIAKLEVKCLNR